MLHYTEYAEHDHGYSGGDGANPVNAIGGGSAHVRFDYFIIHICFLFVINF